ncbi:MAG: molybdopterin dinucleotide binding domain-containing protein [Candidatus Helarchaeota archaeon]
MSNEESFYSFLVPKVKVLASVVRTVSQSVISDKSITSSDYKDALAICLVHPKDMKVLGIKKGNLKITSEFGSVVVKAIETEKEIEEGNIIIPLGPWANQITGAGDKQLQLKNLEVKVEVVSEDVTDVVSMFKKN